MIIEDFIYKGGEVAQASNWVEHYLYAELELYAPDKRQIERTREN